MEKIIEENDIKGLEEEIDSAVDRLFVEKQSKVPESSSMELPSAGPSYKQVKEFDQESSVHPSPEPSSIIKSFEKMETQLLSLEWEITKENLEKTKEEVLGLREDLKERSDITSVLNLMMNVLIRMSKNKENIKPPQIKFLLDSKETIKLLMRKGTEGESDIYKQLLGGIEARFLYMEGLEEKGAKKPSLSTTEEREKIEMLKMWKEEIEGILNKMNLFSNKMDEILKNLDQHLDRFGQMTRKSAEKIVEKKPLLMDITVFKMDEKIIGIESHKIFKLFKVPRSFNYKYSSQQKIRVKDTEIKMVDLTKILSIENKGSKKEIQILAIKVDEEYKGLMIDQVLKKLFVPVKISGEYGEYFLGMVHWNYQEKPIEIPILNLNKI